MSGWRDYDIHIGVKQENVDTIVHLFPQTPVTICDQEPTQYEDYDEPNTVYWTANDDTVQHLVIGPFGSDELASRIVDYLVDTWPEILETNTVRRAELLNEQEPMVAFVWDEEGIVSEHTKRLVESRYA